MDGPTGAGGGPGSSARGTPSDGRPAGKAFRKPHDGAPGNRFKNKARGGNAGGRKPAGLSRKELLNEQSAVSDKSRGRGDVDRDRSERTGRRHEREADEDGFDEPDNHNGRYDLGCGLSTHR